MNFIDKNNKRHQAKFNFAEKVIYQGDTYIIEDATYYEGLGYWCYWLFPVVGHDIPEDELMEV